MANTFMVDFNKQLGHNYKNKAKGTMCFTSIGFNFY